MSSRSCRSSRSGIREPRGTLRAPPESWILAPGSSFLNSLNSLNYFALNCCLTYSTKRPTTSSAPFLQAMP
jgi:hypothetical protein